jgi:hypothetical protein
MSTKVPSKIIDTLLIDIIQNSANVGFTQLICRYIKTLTVALPVKID